MNYIQGHTLKLQKSFLLVAILFSISVKLFYIVAPSVSMGSPRMSDDSLIYLWAGKMNFNLFTYDQTSVKNVKQLYHESSQNESNQHDLNYRVLGKVVGSFSPVYEGLIGLLFQTKLSLKSIYTISEISIMLLYQFSLVLIFWRLTQSYTISSLAILLSSTLVYQYVPTVMCLSFGLLFLECILRRKAGYAQELVFGVLTLISHPLGVIYFSIAFVLAIFSRKNLWGTITVFLLTGVTSKLIPELLTWTELIPYRKLGGITFNLEIILFQLKKLFNIFTDVYFVEFPVLYLLILLLTICIIYVLFKFSPKSKEVLSILRNKQVIIVICILGVSAVSIFHYLPTKPIEVFKRVYFYGVHFFILSSLSLFFFLTKKNQFRRFALTLLVCTILLNTLLNLTKLRGSVLDNINDRYYVVDENLLREKITDLKNRKIIFIEPEISFMYFILLGGQNYDLFNYSMIKNNEPLLDKYDIISSKNVFVDLLPKTINSLSYNEFNKIFVKRRNGIYANNSRAIYLRNIRNNKLKLKFLYTPNSENFSFTTSNCQSHIGVEWNDKAVNLTIPCPEEEIIIKVNNRETNNWITGISFGDSQRTSWPWGRDDFEVVISSTQGREKFIPLTFSDKIIIDKDLLSYIDGDYKIKYISDQTGFILYSLVKL